MLITTPKTKLKALLADCPAVQAFLGVGSSGAAAAKIYTSWLYTDGMQDLRPMVIIEQAKLRLGATAAGLSNNMWPTHRSLAITLSCADPLALQVQNGKVSPQMIQASTKALEDSLGLIMEQMSDRIGVSDNFSCAGLELTLPPTHNPPEDWAGEEGPYVWMQLMTSEDLQAN